MKVQTILTVSIAAFIGLGRGSDARELVWDAGGGGGSITDGAGTWLTAGQWQDLADLGTAATWNNATPDNAIFGVGGSGASVSMAGGVTVGSITFNPYTSGTTYTFTNADGITINSGILMKAGAGAVTFSTAPITLGASQTWTNNDDSVLRQDAGITNGNSTLTLAGTGSFTFMGALGSGAGGLIKDNSGTLSLTAANTYTGATTIQRGSVILSGAAASGRLDGTSSITVGGGTLTVGTSTVAQNTAPRLNTAAPLTLGLAGYGGGTYTQGLTSSVGGVTQDLPSLTLGPGLNVINSTGAGTTMTTLNFTSPTAPLTRNAGGGTVNYVTAANFTLHFNSALTLTNGIIGGHFTVNQVSSTSDPGNWAALDASNNVIALPSGSYTTQNNTTFDQTVWTSATNLNLDSAAGSGGAISKTLTADRTVNSIRTIGSQQAININLGGFKLTIASGGILAGNGSSNLSFSNGTLATPGDLFAHLTTLNPTATWSAKLDINGGNGSLIKDGRVNLILTNAANSFNGLIISEAGRVESQAQGALGNVNGAISLFGGILRMSATAQHHDGNITVGSAGGTIITGASNFIQTLNGAVTLNGTLTATPDSQAIGQSGTLVFNGDITGGGGIIVGANGAAGRLTELQLNGDNSFAGGVNHTSLNSTQTLAIGSDSALGTGTLTIGGVGVPALRAITAARHVSNAVAVTGDFAVSGSLDLTLSGAVALSANSIVTTSNTGQTVLGGSISGAFALTKAGTGRMTVSGANTYSGGTTVSAGTLLVNNTTGSGTGTGLVSVGADGILGGTGTISGAVSVEGILQGGDGVTATEDLEIEGGVSLADDSVIQLTLGVGGMHSSLKRMGGDWTFDSDQSFTFISAGAEVGFYDNIIVGLASNPGSLGSWTITNANYAGTFAFDGNNVDLTLTAIPEPGVGLSLLGMSGILLGLGRRRKVGAPLA